MNKKPTAIIKIDMSSNDDMVVKLRDTAYAVEANSHEVNRLWSLHAHAGKQFVLHVREDEKYRVDWVQDNSGYLPLAGHVYNNKTMPVRISLFWNILNGKRILFYEPTSRFVDHTLVREWLEHHLPHLFPEKGRNLHTDANNFGHVLNFLREAKAAAG